MKTKDFFVIGLAAMLVSCGGTQFAITSSGENLSALTKVTDNEEPCISPFGGDNGKDLFFAARENNKYYNIYKKENPFSSAMSQKTSGKNLIYLQHTTLRQTRLLSVVNLRALPHQTSMP